MQRPQQHARALILRMLPAAVAWQLTQRYNAYNSCTCVASYCTRKSST
jgi:hypothetical protein